MSTLKISVLIPAFNESAVIDIPIKRCLEAFKTYGYHGEIVIMDSSTDDTSRIAESLGARVVSIPKQGIGKAYIEGLKHVTGDYIVMGDADGTYDFMEMNRFIDRLASGDDFVMGSRLKGDIKLGSMPWSHRYIGTPLLTGFINLFYKTSISDCNSGLRALTKDAYQKMDLHAWGWEYASEMVLKAARLNLKISEIPVSLSPDIRNRVPHLNPWLAGWTNLRLIFMLAFDKLFFKLGLICFPIGTVITSALVMGPYHIFGVRMGMFYMFIGLILSTLGLQWMMTALLIKHSTFLYHFQNQALLKKWVSFFSFESGLIISSLLYALSFIIFGYIFLGWQQTSAITNLEIKQALIAMYFISVASHVFIFSIVGYLFSMRKDRHP